MNFELFKIVTCVLEFSCTRIEDLSKMVFLPPRGSHKVQTPFMKLYCVYHCYQDYILRIDLAALELGIFNLQEAVVRPGPYL